MSKFRVSKLHIWFGSILALKDVSLEILPNEILSIIGPSNSGKTTFLRMLNRMNELQPNFKSMGRVDFDDADLCALDIEDVRRRVGIVFALPLPLPMSIFDNVA